MSSLEGVRRGDVIVVFRVALPPVRVEVTAAGPKWVTADGHRFARSDGTVRLSEPARTGGARDARHRLPSQPRTPTEAMTVAEFGRAYPGRELPL